MSESAHRSSVKRSANAKGVTNVARIAVAGALMGVAAMFGTPAQEQTQVNDPTTITRDDAINILLAKEVSDDALASSGSGGLQIIVYVSDDGTIVTTSGGLVIGNPSNPSCYITHTGAIRGCVLE